MRFNCRFTAREHIADNEFRVIAVTEINAEKLAKRADVRLARLAAQAAVAQQRFDQAETDAEADERRAKEVQRQRQARQDAAAAAMVAQKKKEQKATMAYVQMQQRAHVEQDALVLQANRREAALNRIEFEKALKRDDERRNAVDVIYVGSDEDGDVCVRDGYAYASLHQEL